jgi:hypothetical protein
MVDVSAASLAGGIQSLPTPAPATPAPAAAVAPAPAPAAAPDNTLLYAVAGLLVVAIALVALVALRRRPAAVEVAPPVRSRDATSRVAAANAGEDDEEQDGAERTVVMRSPEVAAVERTVMLRVQPSLTVTRGLGQGKVFNLNAETSISIGRAPSNDIPLNDSAVSGEHCRVRPEGGNFVVHDLKSTNGTFVNEKRIERHRLSEGDEIRIGETCLRFKLSL